MKTRSEIEEKYKYDLLALYKSEEDITKDINKIKEINNSLEKYEGKILDNSDNLFNVMKLNEENGRLYGKLSMYSMLKYDTDTSNEESKKMLDKIIKLGASINEKLCFISIELKKISLSKWNKLKKENTNLNIYDYFFKEIIRQKKHNIKPSDERLLSRISLALNVSEEIRETLANEDFYCKNVLVDGKEEVLTENNYSLFLISKDEFVRKQAYENILEFYKKHNNTFSALYKSFVRENNIYAKLYNYKSTLDLEMDASDFKIDVYNNLIDVVRNNLDLNKRYIETKKKTLNKDNIKPYDLYVNVHESTKKYVYEDAKDIIYNSLDILGKEYKNKLDKCFNERWIDVYTTLNKNSIQYSTGVFDSYPYIHLNYNSDFESVLALAHEIGHSIHKSFSKDSNDYYYFDNTIFIGEIISNVNELLVQNYILENSNTKEEKLFILNNLISHLKSSVFGQTLLAEFEKKCTELDLEDEVLTSNVLNDVYKDLVYSYNGNTVEKDELTKYNWQRIPHFFAGNGFYVYKYATGVSIALAIVEDILNNKNNMKSKYIDLLKKGSSKSDYNLLKELGIDITNKEYLENAMNMFRYYIEKYEELLK